MRCIYRSQVNPDVPIDEREWPAIIMCAQRRREMQWGWRWHCGKTLLWIAYGVLTVLLIAGFYDVNGALVGKILACIGGLIIAGVFCAFVERFVEQTTSRRFLQHELWSRGINVCAACGHCLTRLQLSERRVCPECGTQCTLRPMNVRDCNSEDGATS